MSVFSNFKFKKALFCLANNFICLLFCALIVHPTLGFRGRLCFLERWSLFLISWFKSSVNHFGWGALLTLVCLIGAQVSSTLLNIWYLHASTMTIIRSKVKAMSQGTSLKAITILFNLNASNFFMKWLNWMHTSISVVRPLPFIAPGDYSWWIIWQTYRFI